MKIIYFNNGSKKITYTDGLDVWFDQEDKAHREDGPAETYIYSDFDFDVDSSTYGERVIKTRIRWYWHGKRIEAESLEHFQKLVKLLPFS